eukprot:gnl/TRDRNA2_/TRDRNA2_172942_c0_seq1.p1 gnl/TRDRNA2_/TRDRNA2_172942_c0~~gnl/TRDRNA2_/TRDRNA2_172942_c0_seq1.p1  ORF type:complete len:392 (-),score=38.27 gnl/TRDRNA2_/TRDRNA2_172942_c0_seq1:138-1313(-)
MRRTTMMSRTKRFISTGIFARLFFDNDVEDKEADIYGDLCSPVFSELDAFNASPLSPGSPVLTDDPELDAFTSKGASGNHASPIFPHSPLTPDNLELDAFTSEYAFGNHSSRISSLSLGTPEGGNPTMVPETVGVVDVSARTEREKASSDRPETTSSVKRMVHTSLHVALQSMPDTVMCCDANRAARAIALGCDTSSAVVVFKQGGLSDILETTGCEVPKANDKLSALAELSTPIVHLRKTNGALQSLPDLVTFTDANRTVTVGRSASNTVVVNDKRISKVHCRLMLRQFRLKGSTCESTSVRLFILDCSTFGTFVNGKALFKKQWAILEEGDLLGIFNPHGYGREYRVQYVADVPTRQQSGDTTAAMCHADRGVARAPSACWLSNSVVRP